MSDGTSIEWTDATWNPITGCSVVSPGCTNCYAMKLAGTRLRHTPSRAGLTRETNAGPVWNGQVRLNEQWLEQPLRWRRPRRIFVCAHGDLFHESVPDEWIAAVFGVMAASPQHTFQVLTKRAARMREWFNWHKRQIRARELGFEPWRVCEDEAVEYVPELPAKGCRSSWPLRNVWLGVSVEDQRRADERIPLLLQTPAAVRWLSCEPLLGPLNLVHLWVDPTCTSVDIDWVVAGGESGPDARPMHPEWPRSLRGQCVAAGVPFFFKQWGAWRPPLDGEDYDTSMGRAQRVPCFIVDHATGHVRCFENDTFVDAAVMRMVGKKAAGRELDGRTWDEFPESPRGG